jgi:hypothetical protein
MPGLSDLGKALLLIGGVVVLLGLALLLVGRVPFLGRLLGDVALKRGNTTVYLPIATCLVLSTVLTILVNVVLFLVRRR